MATFIPITEDVFIRSGIDEGDGLHHHGRLGQKWGTKNGPPYPLSTSAVRKAYGKKRRGLSGYLQSRKEKKAAKAAEEEQEKRKAIEREKEQHEADKERVLREGSATEVMQYLGEISNQELSNALNRIKWTNELAKLSQSEIEKGWKTVDSVMKKVGNVKDWTKIGVELWEQVDKAIGLIEKDQKRKASS